MTTQIDQHQWKRMQHKQSKDVAFVTMALLMPSSSTKKKEKSEFQPFYNPLAFWVNFRLMPTPTRKKHDGRTNCVSSICTRFASPYYLHIKMCQLTTTCLTTNIPAQWFGLILNGTIKSGRHFEWKHNVNWSNRKIFLFFMVPKQRQQLWTHICRVPPIDRFQWFEDSKKKCRRLLYHWI